MDFVKWEMLFFAGFIDLFSLCEGHGRVDAPLGLGIGDVCLNPIETPYDPEGRRIRHNTGELNIENLSLNIANCRLVDWWTREPGIGDW